jgi:hypothetical protein
MLKFRICLIAAYLVMKMTTLSAQELFVFTEPASNMPAKSLGVRLTNEGFFQSRLVNRTIVEVMLGASKNLMIHGQGFLSNMDKDYRFEGASAYAKYRFLSFDEVRSHFRASAFGRISFSERAVYTRDINLEGDNTGVQGGLIFTQLLHKLALSGTISYTSAFGQREQKIYGFEPDQMIGYSLSSGYLLLPVIYKNYNQPNFNVYLETLGKTDPVNGRSYVDLAPAVQIIFNSRTRIDIGYRFQVAGNMENRYLKNMYLLRLELNFFNVLR